MTNYAIFERSLDMHHNKVQIKAFYDSKSSRDPSSLKSIINCLNLGSSFQTDYRKAGFILKIFRLADESIEL